MPDASIDAVNERLFRLEAEVDDVKSDLSEQKVAVARITEQVSAHEKRGEERHVQLMSAITEMKQDYRMVFQQQAEDSKAHLKAQMDANRTRSANQTKIILAIITTIGTIVGAIYGFSPTIAVNAETSASAPAPAP